MIKLGVEITGINSTLAFINGQARQVQYAAAVALTRTAGKVKEALPSELDKQLDRPTPFTKRGIFLRPARKDNLEAVVGFMDKQASYLRWQIEGGTRRPNKKALRLPGNVTLDAYGNLPKDTIKRLIEAAASGKYGVAVRRRLGVGGNRRKGSADLDLFYGQPKGMRNLPVGIWRRVGNQIVPVIVFPEKSATYKPRLKLQEFAARVVAAEWPRQFEAALQMALRSAR